MPLPLGWLGQWRRAYAGFEPVVARLSATLPLAVFDTLLVAMGAGVAWIVWRHRGRVPLLRTAASVAGIGAAVWLLFLSLWGWNYQVPTLEARLGPSVADASVARGESFARATVTQLNALHASAHDAPWPTWAQMPAVLGPRLDAVLPPLGVSRTPWLPVPRRTMLDWYFRAASIDGMTNPFGLEILLNSRVLPVELPALVAHEYAHLAGFADEADASVVAWLACQRGTPALRYSGALAVLPHLVAGLPAATRREVVSALEAGPRRDLEAIRARLSEQQPWVHAVAWQSYDRFLRANRVAEGVARYDAVARVLIAAADPLSGSLARMPTPWPPRPAHGR